MADVADDLEMLLSDVRRTISDNKQFLEKLVDEAIEVDTEDDPDTASGEGSFEEL